MVMPWYGEKAGDNVTPLFHLSPPPDLSQSVRPPLRTMFTSQRRQ